MKVAIVTWFHYHNYGTALQVTALYKTIQDMGHDVDIVNYIPQEKITSMPTMGVFSYYVKRATEEVKRKLNPVYYGKQREILFDNFYDKNVSFTEKCVTFSDFRELNKSYDAFVCGSDQIWAPSCFDSRYFLDFVESNNKMIAFAPSVGLKEIKDKDIAYRVKELASRFKWISTREKSGSELIENLTGKKVKTVVDPTLLLSDDKWCESFTVAETKDKPYLVAYFLRSNKKYLKRTYFIAKKLNLEVKIIPVFEKDFKLPGCIQAPIGPEEFLSLIKNASYVCTDSFHGTAFAINFKKQFLTFERFRNNESNNQNSRIYNILKLTGLEDRLYSAESDISTAYDEINYNAVGNKLSKARKDSSAFLKKALDSVEKVSQKDVARVGKDSTVCCGCAACSEICPTNAIAMEDKNGFKTAVVDNKKCISCSKCAKVCPFFNKASTKKIKDCNVYSYKDSDTKVLKKSSSGGLAYRIAKIYLKMGYSVVGCAFDKNKQCAKHIVITPDEQEKLSLLQGSKYMQSDFSNAIKEVKEGSTPLVVFGTPCQISGAKKVAPKGREIIYVDLICHGVPSGLVYKKYIEYLKQNHNMDKKNLEVLFRYKQHGWKNRYIYASNGKGVYEAHQSKDPYFRLFESGFAYAESCYDCRFRDATDADIRIGDYWGSRFSTDNTGVSMMIIASEVGESVVKEVSAFGDVKRQDIKDYFENQQFENEPLPVFYKRLFNSLTDDKTPIVKIVNEFVKPFEKKKKVYSNIYKIVKAIKKI